MLGLLCGVRVGPVLMRGRGSRDESVFHVCLQHCSFVRALSNGNTLNPTEGPAPVVRPLGEPADGSRCLLPLRHVRAGVDPVNGTEARQTVWGRAQ